MMRKWGKKNKTLQPYGIAYLPAVKKMLDLLEVADFFLLLFKCYHFTSGSDKCKSKTIFHFYKACSFYTWQNFTMRNCFSHHKFKSFLKIGIKHPYCSCKVKPEASLTQRSRENKNKVNGVNLSWTTKAIFNNANKTAGFHHPKSVDIKSPEAEPDLFRVL